MSIGRFDSDCLISPGSTQYSAIKAFGFAAKKWSDAAQPPHEFR
jgi:hypothetical protein